MVTFNVDLSGATSPPPPFEELRGNMWFADLTRGYVDRFDFEAFDTSDTLVYQALNQGVGGTGEYSGALATPAFANLVPSWNGLGIFRITGVAGSFTLTNAGMQGRNLTNFPDDGYTQVAFGTTIPEPTTLALFGLGLAGLVAWRRKRRKAA